MDDRPCRLTPSLAHAPGRRSTSFNPVILEIPGVLDYNPPNYMFCVGILYGIMGALLAVYYVACQLLVKAAFHPLKKAAKRIIGERAGRVVVAVVGGTLYGVVGWALPLTMGDGSFQLVAPISDASEIDTAVLAASCFLNIFTYWVSVESGFVGGLFTPLLYSGSLLGAVFSNISQINTQVAVSCSFVALAAALIPAPITLCFFAASIFRLGAPYLFPLMTCCFTSHILFDGTGIARHLTGELRAKRLRRLRRQRKPTTVKDVDASSMDVANIDA
jgi:H+/Cl- antiporter ClcA